ncbi:hypothetical protein ABC304_01025 [Microbacterium sp. 1P10UB]|uniref:hypothetical protein n=1 Tax=unclassified Microbacterium TaxID=2609290 RepID=UPI00399FBC5F
MRPWLVWTIGLALLVAAWAVIQITPSDDAAVTPFDVSGAIGDSVSGRAFEASVTDVRLGDRAEADGWSAESTWVVVDVTAQALLDEQGSLLGHADLIVDGVRYRASERPTSVFRTGLSVGLPRSGSIAFEVPAGVTERSGVIELGLTEETRLDSVVRVPVDLAELDRSPDVELRRTEWAR